MRELAHELGSWVPCYKPDTLLLSLLTIAYTYIRTRIRTRIAGLRLPAALALP